MATFQNTGLKVKLLYEPAREKYSLGPANPAIGTEWETHGNLAFIGLDNVDLNEQGLGYMRVIGKPDLAIIADILTGKIPVKHGQIRVTWSNGNENSYSRDDLIPYYPELEGCNSIW